MSEVHLSLGFIWRAFGLHFRFYFGKGEREREREWGVSVCVCEVSRKKSFLPIKSRGRGGKRRRLVYLTQCTQRQVRGAARVGHVAGVIG